jgi:arginine utilization regulatory protein
MFNDSMMELLNNLDEGITAIDSTSQIVFLNNRAARMENIDISSAIGRHLLEVYPSLSDRTSTLLKVLHTGKPIFDNLQTFKNYKGENITTVNSTVPIKKNKKVIGAVEISRDITRMRKLSEEVVELKSELISRNSTKTLEHKVDVQHNQKSEDALISKNNGRPMIRGYTFMDIIGQSGEMLKLKAFALKAAASLSPVLIYGETGTGKELFVQAIHNSSERKLKPFIAQNCAALPSTLLEGILFGTVKGGFTGAEDRPGLFELADKGTLYLDELNSMPLDLQAKLLRVLQDGCIRRVGDIKEKEVDVRIIASTNIEPNICIKEGLLRSDLYYRLNVIGLRIPDLKNRKSDIPLMLEYFISKYNAKLGRRIHGITNEAMERIMSYEWPGNVRELQHVIESVINMKESGSIEEEDLPETIKRSINRYLVESIEEVEKNIIIESLKLWNNNISKTADYLKLPRQTLQYKLRKYEL